MNGLSSVSSNVWKPWLNQPLTACVSDALMHCGAFQLRTAQLPPRGDDWLTWLLMGGRGSGKTRAGAEWINGLAYGFAPFSPRPVGPIALIGETFADVREVMIDGPAGIRACAPFEPPHYEVARRRLVWPNGICAQVFSGEDPESLRGPQFAAAWWDELGKFSYGRECWDMLQFGLRTGPRPRQMVTTTPRAVPLLRELIDAPSTVVAHMRTADNAKNLPDSFLDHVNRRYGNTGLGRQELDGEMIEQRRGALWSRSMLDQCQISQTPPMRRIVVAVDPPASGKVTSDACGIVVAGLDEDGRGVVLGDHTVRAAAPNVWAARVATAYEASEADMVVAEINQGGDMVTAVLRTAHQTIPVSPVRATRAKHVRAEPVAALYQQGRVRHAGRFRELEDEMCDLTVDGLSSRRSPDRLDALVWALTALMLAKGGEPRVRGFD
jgi:phage terminase large subunit-like protein